MTADRVDAVRGASPETVREALTAGDPLPGTSGFCGALATAADALVVDSSGRAVSGCGGRLVRDVLGRQPLFVEAFDAANPRWSVDPARLDDPRPVPPGSVLDLSRDDDALDSTTDSTDGVAAASARVWSLPDPPAATDREGALDAVERAVRDSVGSVDSGDGELAVAFSGGVDSALVAAGIEAAVDGGDGGDDADSAAGAGGSETTGGAEVPWYVVGFPDSHDVAAARAAADAMTHSIRVVELDHDTLVDAVPAVVRATGRTNPMDVCIALPLYLAACAAAADGATRLAVGQGADELFGGYAKVVEPSEDSRVDADTVRGARRETVETLPRQLDRDVLTLRAAGVEPVAPYLHDAVVAAALPLPDDLLATPAERKVALRHTARGVIPDAVVDADKKAVQYGSLVSRELDRLARQAGFKRRMDDHVGRYVRSLVDGA